MQVIVTATTMIGGHVYTSMARPQSVPDNYAQHMIDIGNAVEFVTKVVEPEVTKKKSLSASQPAPVSQEKTAKPRRTRKPKSSQ